MNGEWKATAVRWVTGGTACAVAIKVLDVLQQQPQMVEKILNWGPPFFLAVLGIYLVDRRAAQFVAAQERNAGAIERFVGEQHRLADSTRDIAESVHFVSQRDDQRAREQDILLDHLAQNSEQVLEKLHSIMERLPK